ncbi:MAG: outer membrane protein assembly factor BamD [Planctomycetaceae bacterium]|nr:outer membrane protein assembly factor BamD [Planctomycetaceae bacterium]
MDVDRAYRRTAWLLVACSAAGLANSGCQTGRSFAALRPLDEPASIDGVMGPSERRLQAVSWEQRREQLQNSGLNVEGLQEFDSAQRFYDAGEFKAAEKAFQTLAKQRARAGKTWQGRWKDLLARNKTPATGLFGSYGDPIEEDALFMVAECQFAQKQYSWSQDSYGTLLEKYPSTRHLDDVTRRLFFIAQTWLGVPPTTAKVNDVQLVDHSENGDAEPTIAPVGGPSSWPIVPNLIDRTRPVFDTHGRALQALESIWRHDAAGPLADDALMLQATYYQRKGDYVEAGRYYKLVREQYPDSPHFQSAFLLGSHVSLASYDGAEYEGGPLTESRQLKETSRHLFQNLSDEQKQRLDTELKVIREAEVEREWETVQFYLHKAQPESVAVHCNVILHNYPDSPYAQRAWETLEQIRPRLKPEEVAIFIGNAPRPTVVAEGAAEPSARTGIDATSPESEAAEPSTEEWWNSPGAPQPTEQTPQLRPVGPEAVDNADAEPPARLKL